MEICPQDKRYSLEIRFDDDGKVSLARCCFLYAFSHLSLNEYAEIDDIIDYAENQKINYAKSSNICIAKCVLDKKIRQVDVGISHACNMKCLNCFFKEHKDTPEMKKAYFDTLYKIKGHQLDTIMINNGGEVFVYYKEIAEYLRTLTPDDTRQVTFVTNLVLLNEERIKELKQISLDTGVNYFFLPSVDGIHKESYEAIRIGGTFEKVTENLHILSEVFGGPNAVILYTIKKPNLDEVEDVEKYFMDNFKFRVSISFDVYDKECENKYNSIFRKDLSEQEKIVSAETEPVFKASKKEVQRDYKKQLSIVTLKVPKEETIKRLTELGYSYLFIFSNKKPKWSSNYSNLFFVKLNKKTFYRDLSFKINTPYFMFVQDVDNFVVNTKDVFGYFLDKVSYPIIKINNIVATNPQPSYNLIIKYSEFKALISELKTSKNIEKDFLYNIGTLMRKLKFINVPEEVCCFSDKKFQKKFLKQENRFDVHVVPIGDLF